MPGYQKSRRALYAGNMISRVIGALWSFAKRSNFKRTGVGRSISQMRDLSECILNTTLNLMAIKEARENDGTLSKKRRTYEFENLIEDKVENIVEELFDRLDATYGTIA